MLKKIIMSDKLLNTLKLLFVEKNILKFTLETVENHLFNYTSISCKFNKKQNQGHFVNHIFLYDINR
jgi:hypothetical protein